MTSLPSALSLFAIHIALTMLPVVAGLLVARALGVTDELLLVSLGLCGLLVTGYVTFWIFWASPTAGRAFSVVLTPSSSSSSPGWAFACARTWPRWARGSCGRS